MTHDELIAEYRRLAALGQFQGHTVLRYETHLKKLCLRYQAKSLLDYGSGHGIAWSGGLQVRLGLDDVRRYDPAIPAFAEKPQGTFHAVACVDVLEHVLRDDVPAVIADLFRYAERFVFATVCCRPAKKLFPDKTNMHVTIEPIDWWRERFSDASPHCSWVLVESP